MPFLNLDFDSLVSVATMQIFIFPYNLFFFLKHKTFMTNAKVLCQFIWHQFTLKQLLISL